MAVPDTTTFELQDVIDEISPTTDDLQSCFDDASASEFDPTYEGSKDNLLNFRNYGGRTQFFIGGTGYGSAAAACGTSYLVKYYHDGAAIAPANGDTVYTAPTGATAFVGGSSHYAISGYTIQVDNFGTVSNKTVCAPL